MEFEQFARERLPDLVRFTTALCTDRALAEDLVQDVLLRLYERWPRVAALDVPDAYVRRCLVNEYLSWRRKWSRMVPHEAVPETTDGTDGAQRLADRSELVSDLAGLPPRQRAVLVLRYFEDLPDTEIAEILGCRTVTVRGYASRGLAALRIDTTERNLRRTWSGHA